MSWWLCVSSERIVCSVITSRHSPTGRRRGRSVSLPVACLASACAAAAFSACEGGTPTGRGSPALIVARAAGIERIVEPRLSLDAGYAPCPNPASLCGVPVPGATHRLARAAVAIRSADMPQRQRLVAAGGLELVASLEAGNGVGASVSLFESAAELAPKEVTAWSDLAAAYLVRSVTTGSSSDAIHAVQAAEQAAELDPSDAPSLFNLALALDHLGLQRAALEAWESYVHIDPRSGWSREAQAHMRRLKTTPTVHPTGAGPAPGPGSERDDGAGGPDPGRARLLAMDSLLPAWGSSLLSGDTASADRALDGAARIGRALSSRSGDRTVSISVAQIRSLERGAPAARDRVADLARAHAAYGRGRRSYAEGAYGDASAAFDDAARSIPPTASALQGWIEFHRAATRMYAGDVQGAAGKLRTLVSTADKQRSPALAGRAVWGLGTIALREGRFEEARSRFRQATALFEGAGEVENAGATRYLTAESGMALGQTWSAVDSAVTALRALNVVGRPTVWLHNLLYSFAAHVEGLGFAGAARAIQEEGVAVAAEMGNPVYHAEAVLARARLQLREGRREAARADLFRADTLLASIDDPVARGWIANDRAYTSALLSAPVDPAPAASTFEDVASFFSKAGSVPRQAAALLDLAHALGLAGAAERRRQVLDDVVRIGEEQVAAASTFPLRASLAMVVRTAVLEAVDHDLATGDPHAALELLNRWSAIRVGRPARPVTVARRSDPDLGVGVTYLLGDSSITAWVTSDGDLRVSRVDVEASHVRRLVASLAPRGQASAPDADMTSSLGELYELLIAAPFADGVPPGLRIYAEGELAAVPFAALRNPRTDRYLVQDATVEYKTTVADAMAPSPEKAPSGREAKALVVAADVIQESDPWLPPLPGARDEAVAVARVYPASTLLSGRDATPSAFARAARDKTVLHFAGHAVVDAERPWSSHLVLAPDKGDEGGALAVDRLTRIVSEMDVVVLAACRSASPESRASEGFAGFADALLAAGTGVAIGSIWDVPDRNASPLLERFHQLYANGVPPPEALRRAQLEALESNSTDGRGSLAWAGFRALTR